MKSIYTFVSLFFLVLNAFSQPSSIPQERWQKAELFLSQQKDASGFFMLAKDGRIMMEKGLGYADREQKIPFDHNTLFSIGSITKSFTATAILLLMEKGLVDVQDPITKYFDEIPDDKKSITIHQLLTHSAGFPGAIGDDYEIISTTDFQKRAWATPLLFAPGQGYNYSNVGYSLLGMIVEKVSGESYSAFLQKNIFKPAFMSTAGYTNDKADYSRLAHGYFQDGGDWGTAKDKSWDGNEPSWNLKGNGGVLMTAMDLYHWYLALRNNMILKPATLKLQTTPHVKEGEDDSYYGYGFVVSPDGEVVQHNGGNRVFKADFRWYPKSDMVLVSVSNDANTRLFRLNDQIIDILTTGNIPETIHWTIVPIDKFPDGPQQETAKKFIELLQQYSDAEREKFIGQFFTPGILERNTKEHINTLFQMLSQDIGKGPVQKVETSPDVLQITMPAGDGGGRMKIKLNFIGESIDRIGAEME